MSIKIDVNINEHTIGDKIWNTNVWTTGLNWDIGQTFAKIVDPWVPYDTGKLSQDISYYTSATSGGVEVVYESEYAQKQYYGEEFHHKTEVHPLATAKWDQVAMQTKRDEFAKEVERIIKERYKNG
jgi:hypothetical protein